MKRDRARIEVAAEAAVVGKQFATHQIELTTISGPTRLLHRGEGASTAVVLYFPFNQAREQNSCFDAISAIK